MSKPKYDSTVARIAGNILSGSLARVDGGNSWGIRATEGELEAMARGAVQLARYVVAEVERTEPKAQAAA